MDSKGRGNTMNTASLAMVLLSGTCMALVAACGGGGVPTYSDILATYHSGVELCRTEAVIVEVNEDQILFDIPPGAFGMEILNFEPQYRCYGAKLIVGERPVTLGGETYEPGTKLTLDKNLEFVAVSSWD